MIKAVTYILENDSTVQTLVGQNSRSDKHKVFPLIMPQSEVEPYIVVRIASKQRLGKDCGFNYTIDVASYHTSYDDVTELNEAVISALESQASGNVNGVDYGFLNFVNERDEFMVDRIAVTHEHPVYCKISTFSGVASGNGT